MTQKKDIEAQKAVPPIAATTFSPQAASSPAVESKVIRRFLTPEAKQISEHLQNKFREAYQKSLSKKEVDTLIDPDSVKDDFSAVQTVYAGIRPIGMINYGSCKPGDGSEQSNLVDAIRDAVQRLKQAGVNVSMIETRDGNNFIIFRSNTLKVKQRALDLKNLIDNRPNAYTSSVEDLKKFHRMVGGLLNYKPEFIMEFFTRFIEARDERLARMQKEHEASSLPAVTTSSPSSPKK